MQDAKKYIIGLTILLLALALGFLFIGSEFLSPESVIDALLGKSTRKQTDYIIWNIRLPREITAVFAGMGLSVSGLLMQTFFRNSLAGPSILGITSGAGLGVALVTLSASVLGVDIYLYGYTTTVAAVIGASAILFIILLLSRKTGNGVLLLVVGILISSFAGALLTVLQYFTSPEDIQRYILWTMGSTSNTTLKDAILLSIIVSLGIGMSMYLIRPLNALLLGEKYAASMGINVSKTRTLIILTTGLLTGGITAFCGPIAFIGLAVPHLVRLILPTENHNIILPVTLLTGGIVMLIADIIAQVPFSELQLPINAITSIIATPIVIITVLKHQSHLEQ